MTACHDQAVINEVTQPADGRLGAVGVVLPRPLLRGWSHAVAVLPAAVGAAVLISGPQRTPAQRAALLFYGIALVLLFGISALYHRGPWSPRVRAIWRRVDHANIFVMIGATYTAVGATVLDGTVRVFILSAVWVSAIIGVAVVVARIRLPRPVLVTQYLATGWLAIVIVPAIASRVPLAELSLLLTGGVLYSLGAVAYVLQRPRLWPRVFGYHEVFHLLVIAATALFFAFVVLTTTPAAHV